MSSNDDPITTVQCDNCNDDFSVKERYASGQNVCDDCHESEMERRMKETLVPEHRREDDYDGFSWSRTEALYRLKMYNALPIEDFDGRLITGLKFGKFEGERMVKEIVHTVEDTCESCGHNSLRAKWWNIGFESEESVSCPVCGNVRREESSL